MDIEHISVSRANTYRQCPQHYKYHYHLKVPSPVETPFYFTYGKIVHKIAEEYVRQRGEVPLSAIWKDIKDKKIPIEENPEKGTVSYAPPLPNDYAKRLPIHMRSIKNLTSKIGTEGIVEEPFYYDLEPPNGKFIKGFIDRLIFRGDKAFIIDYKTTKPGRFRADSSSVKTDPQLRAYCSVVMKKYDIPADKISAAFFYLEDEQIVSSSYSEESLLAVEQELLNEYNYIKQHDPENVVGKVGHHCNRCPYASICPFKKSESKITSWDGDLSSIVKGV